MHAADFVVEGPVIPEFSGICCLATQDGIYRFFKANEKIGEAALRATGALHVSTHQGVGYVACKRADDPNIRGEKIDWITYSEWYPVWSRCKYLYTDDSYTGMLDRTKVQRSGKQCRIFVFLLHRDS